MKKQYKWQSSDDQPQRKGMIYLIHKMLQDNDHTVLSKKKLHAIKRIELILYTSAPSFQTYSDLTTLKKRMQKAILHSMGLCRAL